jgi:hypothetical protein
MHTYGNTRLKLESTMGYAAASTNGSRSHRAHDEPAAILLGNPGANVGALTVSVRDTKARAEVLKILGKHGLSKSPRRVDSAENVTFIFALSAYDRPYSKQSKPLNGETDPAVSLDTFATDQATRTETNYTLALNGEWVNGSPLSVPRGDLPTVDLDAIFKDVDALLGAAEPAYEPAKLPPEMEAKIAAARKVREAQKAELAKRTDESIWAIVDAAARNVKQRGIGATPHDQAEAILRAESHESRIAHYDQIVAERAEAAERKKKLG